MKELRYVCRPVSDVDGHVHIYATSHRNAAKIYAIDHALAKPGDDLSIYVTDGVESMVFNISMFDAYASCEQARD